MPAEAMRHRDTFARREIVRDAANSGHLPLDVHVDRQGPNVFVGLYGELTLAERERFDTVIAELDREPVAQIVIDLSGVAFADSTGLLLLVQIWKRCRADGTAIAFEGASEQMQRLLEATGVDGVIPIVPSGAVTDTGHRAPHPGAEWSEGPRPPLPEPGGPPRLAPEVRRP
jgi:anti-anti-sigma factor